MRWRTSVESASADESGSRGNRSRHSGVGRAVGRSGLGRDSGRVAWESVWAAAATPRSNCTRHRFRLDMTAAFGHLRCLSSDDCSDQRRADATASRCSRSPCRCRCCCYSRRRSIWSCHSFCACPSVLCACRTIDGVSAVCWPVAARRSLVASLRFAFSLPSPLCSLLAAAHRPRHSPRTHTRTARDRQIYSNDVSTSGSRARPKPRPANLTGTERR